MKKYLLPLLLSWNSYSYAAYLECIRSQVGDDYPRYIYFEKKGSYNVKKITVYSSIEADHETEFKKKFIDPGNKWPFGSYAYIHKGGSTIIQTDRVSDKSYYDFAGKLIKADSEYITFEPIECYLKETPSKAGK